MMMVAWVVLGAVVDVNVGRDGACVVRDDGALFCWGEGRVFEVDDKPTTAPHRIGDLKVRAVAIGGDHACVIDRQGAVLCAGSDAVTSVARGREQDLPDDAPDPGARAWRRVPRVSNATAIASGPHHVCVMSAGELVCWGAENDGRVGPANKDGRPAGVAGLGQVTAFAIDDDVTCALAADHKIRCFGSFSLDDAHDGRRAIITMPFGASTDVGVGAQFVCGLIGKTRVSCHLGMEGKTVTLELPEPAARLVSGSPSPCFEGVSGKLWCSGQGQALLARTGVTKPDAWAAYAEPASHFRMFWSDVIAIGKDGNARVAGSLKRRPSHPPEVQMNPVVVQGLGSVVELAAGGSRACARSTDGSVACWGGSAEDPAVPRPVPELAGATRISVGGPHSCALTSAGVTCTVVHQTENWQVEALPTSSVHQASGIAVGDEHACVRNQAGAVSCWGSANSGALGLESSEAHANRGAAPRAIEGVEGATGISAGRLATCALVKGGRVRCWGRNSDGLLGQGFASDSAAAGEVVGLSGATAVSVGSELSCAIDGGRRAWCWGAGAFAPVPWPGDADVIDVNVGTRDAWVKAVTACIVHANGHVECGVPGSAHELRGITTARSVAVGQGFACALLADATVRCWGKRDQGQLGDGIAPLSTTFERLTLE